MPRIALPLLTLLLATVPPNVLAQSHFADCTRLTGNNATVLIPSSASITLDGSPLSQNSELAVYTQDGLCAGALVWMGADAGFTVWGDDTQTAAKDGLVSGEAMAYRLWDASTGTEYDGSKREIDAAFSNAEPFYVTENGYVENAIFELTSLSLETPPTLAAPALTSPADGAVDQPLALDLSWNPADGALFYAVQIAKDVTFAAPVLNADNVAASTLNAVLSERYTTYYWRVRAVNEAGIGPWSAARSFTTVPLVPPAPALLSPANHAVDMDISVGFTWAPLATAASYAFQIARDAAFTRGLGQLQGLTSTEVRIDTLSYGTTYFWRARASNVAGTGLWSEPFSFTTDSAPAPTPSLSAPVLASPTNGAADQPLALNLSWNSVTGALYYEVQVATDVSFASPVLSASNVVLLTLETTLTERLTAYYWRVRAVYEAGIGPWSTARSFTTLPQVPSPPALLAPADGAVDAETSVGFTWNPSATAASYAFQIARDAAFTVGLGQLQGLSSTEVRVDTLSTGTTYFWRTRASNIAGAGTWSEPYSFATASPPAPSPGPSPILAAPILAAPAHGSADQPLALDLQWQPTAGALSYEVQVARDVSFASPVLSADHVVTSTLAGVFAERSATFYWRVRARYETGMGPWSGVRSFATLPNVPTAPTLVSPADGKADVNTSILFTWNASPEATAYGFQIARDQTFSAGLGELEGLSVGEVRIDTLSPGTTYFWRMRASNVAGTGAWSSTFTFTTTSAPKPPPSLAAPMLSEPVNRAANRPLNLKLTWEPASGALSYEVQVSRYYTFVSLVTGADNVVQSSWQASLTERSITFYWRVRAIFQTGAGPWSEVRSFTTLPLAPPAPAPLFPTNGATDTDTSLRFAWKTSSEATTYAFQLARDQAFTVGLAEIESLTSSEVHVDTLAAGTTYFWRMRAFNVAGAGAWSNVFSLTTKMELPDTANPSAPRNGESVSGSSVLFTWNRAAANTYRFQLAKDEAFSTILVNRPDLEATEIKVSGLELGRKYYWRVGTVNNAGETKWSTSSSVAINFVPTNTENDDVPQTFAVHPNYPNPFNPSTTIRFDLPHSAPVRVVIYNALGALVDVLRNDVMPSGSHEVRWNADNMPSGTYFCRILAGREVGTQTLILVK